MARLASEAHQALELALDQPTVKSEDVNSTGADPIELKNVLRVSETLWRTELGEFLEPARGVEPPTC